MNRLPAVQAWPMLRNFAIIAPSTACVQVGVVEHDERRVAAELHRGAQHAVRGLLEQLPPDRGGTGEAELAQPRVGEDRLRHGAGVRGGEHVHHAGGQAGLLEHLDEVAGWSAG